MKKNSLIILIISVIFLLVNVVTFLNYESYKNYYNDKLVNIIDATLEKDSNITELEIAKILKEKNKDNENVLDSYGYDKKDLFLTEEIKNKLYVNLIINNFITLTCIIIYYIFKFIKEKKRTKEINELIEVIDKINKGNYEFNLSKYKESEFSKLYVTILKTTMLLKEYNEDLKKDRIILKDNIADISHQLRTPLTSSTLLLESLLEEKNMPVKRQREFIEKINDKNEKICNLIDILLKFSKIEPSSIVFKKEKVNVLDILKKVSKNTKELSDAKEVSIDIKCDKNINITCDKSWQEEALTNIVKNSIEYSKEKTSVDVIVEDNNFYTLIKIKDTGKGISKEEISKIFNRFHKSENSTGFGIGLNLAKTIIEKDGGMISVKSKENEYTAFSIKYMKV